MTRPSIKWNVVRRILPLSCVLLLIVSGGITLATQFVPKTENESCQPGTPSSASTKSSLSSSFSTSTAVVDNVSLQSTSTEVTVATPDVTQPILEVQDASQPIILKLKQGEQARQTLVIKNKGGLPLTWAAFVASQDGRNWLSAVPGGATLQPGAEIPMVITASSHDLIAGEYIGTIALLSDGGDQRLIINLLVQSSEVVSPTSTPTKIAASPTPESENPCLPTPTSSVTSNPVIPTPTQEKSSGNASTGKCSFESPYGVTTINADAKLVEHFKELGICWVRFQLSQSKIEVSPGVYNWEKLDKVVATMNAAGIHIDFPIRCFGGSCFSSPSLPTVEQMERFAKAVASRYDGKHGHGIIEAFEIGNEEYDHFPPDVYGPLLQAGYQAIKAVYPEALVGMYGTFRPSLKHTSAVMQSLLNYRDFFDFANFHYYARGGDPRESTSKHPSYREVWQLVNQIFPEKPIWVTEIGWPTTPVSCCPAVSPETQALYLRYIMDESAQSGVIEKVFWFTLNYGAQGDTIYPPSGPLPAYYAFRDYVKQFPLWGKASQG